MQIVVDVVDTECAGDTLLELYVTTSAPKCATEGKSYRTYVYAITVYPIPSGYK